MFTKILALFLLFTASAEAAYFPTFTINNFDQFGIYNATPPTLTDGSVGQLQLDTNGNLKIVQSGTAVLPTGASTSANQVTAQTSLDTIVTNTTGASTAALQTSGNTTLSAISAQLPTSLGNKVMANSLSVTLSSDQSALPVTVSGTGKTPINANASGSAAAATITTQITLTAPTNSVGFILMNLDTSTANIRWSLGRTSSATLGQQLQPGRDSGFVPFGGAVSIIAESGTQNYDIQWISQ